MSATIKSPIKRRAAKGARRKQLIEATIDSIAKHGLGDTTMAHISSTAGLSQGIINLHFTSKENLLTETLKYVRDEYEEGWKAALGKAPDEPASQLAALLRADYKATVTDAKKLAVWFAFWGEVKARPTYKKICQERVTDYNEILEGLLSRLIAEGQYVDLNATELAEGIMAMADGLWLNMLISASTLKRGDAEKIMMHYLAQLFPKHKNVFV